MTNLLDTPIEIQQEILSYLRKCDLKDVRLSCKALSLAANRHLFSSVTFREKSFRLIDPECHNFLGAMSQSSGALIAKSIRKLEIYTLNCENLETETTILARLMGALRRMTNIVSVNWCCVLSPWWMRDSLILALSQCESIKELHLDECNYVLKDYPEAIRSMKLDSLAISGMRDSFARKTVGSFLVEQTQLSSLKIWNIRSSVYDDYDDDEEDEYEEGSSQGEDGEKRVGLSIQDIFKRFMETHPGQVSKIKKLYLRGVVFAAFSNDLRRCLRNLTVLCVFRTTRANKFDTIWDTFKVYGQHLTTIATNTSSDSLMKYLCSYKGLREFIYQDKRETQYDDRATISLWLEVIPNHIDTLESFILCDAHSKSWLYGPEAMRTLFRCRNLKRLALVVESVNRAEELIITSARFPSVLEWLVLSFEFPSVAATHSLKFWLTTTRFSEFQPKAIALGFSPHSWRYLRVLRSNGWFYEETDGYNDIDQYCSMYTVHEVM